MSSLRTSRVYSHYSQPTPRLLSISGFAAILLFSLALAFPVQAETEAEEGQDCPTWFPDLRCDRDPRYEGFIPPMSMPYLFEEPFINTGAQFALLYHKFPGVSAFRGGYATVMALQLRAAITDRLAFIATKDGLTFFRPDTRHSDVAPTLSGRRLLKNETGIFDMTAGFKYAVVDWKEKNLIVTPSLRYEIPMGHRSLFQRGGKGVLIPALSMGWGLQNFHFLGSVGAQFGMDTKKNSDSVFWNFHFDYALHDYFVPFFEISGMHWTRSGNGTSAVNTTLESVAGLGKITLNTAQAVLGTGPFEGVDVANLGSRGMTGRNYATWGLGFRVPISRKVSLGFSYEEPVRKEFITERRISFMAHFDI